MEDLPIVVLRSALQVAPARLGVDAVGTRAIDHRTAAAPAPLHGTIVDRSEACEFRRSVADRPGAQELRDAMHAVAHSPGITADDDSQNSQAQRRRFDHGKIQIQIQIQI